MKQQVWLKNIRRKSHILIIAWKIYHSRYYCCIDAADRIWFIKAIQYAAMNRLLQQRKVYLDDATDFRTKINVKNCWMRRTDADIGVCSFDLNNLRRINDSRDMKPVMPISVDLLSACRIPCRLSSLWEEQVEMNFFAVTHGLDREQMTQCLEKVRRDMTEESECIRILPKLCGGICTGRRFSRKYNERTV